MHCRAFLLLLLLQTAAAAQERVPGIEFLNERLRIPESAAFDEGAYIESGVGLSFGVDKRLTYMAGEYEEAAQRFEQSVRQFRLKAEIWVYLARAYFYMNSPDRTRETLRRAEAQMPDLSQRLWQPLIASLEFEIRQRAAQQQARVDFYSTGQDDVFNLFRLYLFLDDDDSAIELVRVSHQRAGSMRERAEMVSGASRKAQVDEAQRWDDLGDRLAGELRAAGIAVPTSAEARAAVLAPDEAPPDIDEDERIRILQLRVDFYRAVESDYERLFAAYLDRGDTTRARAVVASLDRHLVDLGVQASVAPTIDEQATMEDRIETFKALRGDLLELLPATPPMPARTTP